MARGSGHQSRHSVPSREAHSIVFFSSAFAGDFLSLDQRESQAFPHGGTVWVDGGADGGNVVGVHGTCYVDKLLSFDTIYLPDGSRLHEQQELQSKLNDHMYHNDKSGWITGKVIQPVLVLEIII